MQQSGPHVLLCMNGDRDDAPGYRIPELPMASLTRAKLFEPVPLEQPYEFRPRHANMVEPNVGFVKDDWSWTCVSPT